MGKEISNPTDCETTHRHFLFSLSLLFSFSTFNLPFSYLFVESEKFLKSFLSYFPPPNLLPLHSNLINLISTNFQHSMLLMGTLSCLSLFLPYSRFTSENNLLQSTPSSQMFYFLLAVFDFVSYTFSPKFLDLKISWSLPRTVMLGFEAN